MKRSRVRAFFGDALFVVLVMVAAVGSAVLEANSVLTAYAAGEAKKVATQSARTPAAGAASTVDGTLLSAAAAR
jgi:hypothetical protein